MRYTANTAAVRSTTSTTLRQIQEQVQDMCEPRYHEYHKMTVEPGFIKITLPKRRP